MQKQINHAYVHPIQEQLLKLCHSNGLPLHGNRLGPKTFTEYQKMSLVLLLRRSKKSLRDFVKDLPEIRWPSWLGLPRLPSKSSLHDWCKKYSAKFIRRLNLSLLSIKKPKLLAIDATGIDSWQRSRHYEKRIGRTHQPYAKLSVLIDTEDQLVFDHVLQIKPRHDVIAAESMFKRTSLRDVQILGDKGYDSEPLHEVAESRRNLLYAPVRERERKKIKGKHRRRCSQGSESYNRRNTVESCIHSLKSRIVPALRSRKAHMKKRETAWYLLVHNLEKISRSIRSYLRIMLRMIPDKPA